MSYVSLLFFCSPPIKVVWLKVIVEENKRVFNIMYGWNMIILIDIPLLWMLSYVVAGLQVRNREQQFCPFFKYTSPHRELDKGMSIPANTGVHTYTNTIIQSHSFLSPTFLAGRMNESHNGSRPQNEDAEMFIHSDTITSLCWHLVTLSLTPPSVTVPKHSTLTSGVWWGNDSYHDTFVGWRRRNPSL